MDQYFNYNINGINEFIDLYVPEKKSRPSIKNKLKIDYANKKQTPLVRAFLIYLKFSSNNANTINRDDTPPQTPKPPVEDSDEPDESSDDEVLVPEKKQEIKPKISLLERAIGTLPVFQLHGKPYPDEFNKINDDDLSIDEKNIIASKILNYKIY